MQACAASANNYGAVDALKKLGVDVKPMGTPLTDMIKAENTKVLTF